MSVFEKKFSLLENAQNFIEESIYSVAWARDKPSKWPFAILHLIQGLELLIKHLLASHHKILVYENIDNPKNTVSLQQGLDRLISLDSVNIDEKERAAIISAVKFRNNIVHYEYNLNEKQAEVIYCELFEFMHFFYRKHIKADLQDIIDRELWHTEAELLSKFKKQFVIYHGEEVAKEHPLSIVESQLFNAYKIDGQVFKRVASGDEDDPFNQITCGDCGVKAGMYHTYGCDHEQCPKCSGQLISCRCDAVEYYEVVEAGEDGN
ncbi:hypothetical protein [Hymenobacter cheonanensis]|uniref:hypothetical protein n=1 Tax=Hymenobacter sp. CA2-7 TaxID=3063993 RepID=UPI00271242A2|nr:hypothetical protein [Hymenobacter sp. CA2-7]MDO7884297.1 hypothetical protein [Hymenobacter sp. CA2-7]